MADIPGTDIYSRFLVLPSPPPSLNLMVKSIAVQELMMPSDTLTSEEQPPHEALKAVEHCLDKVSTFSLKCKGT